MPTALAMLHILRESESLSVMVSTFWGPRYSPILAHHAIAHHTGVPGARAARRPASGVDCWPHGAKRDQFVEHLAEVPLFSACSKKDLQQVAKRAEDVTVEAGKVLVSEARRAPSSS